VSAENHPLIQLLPSVYQRALKGSSEPGNVRPPNLALQALLDVMVELQRPDQELLAELDTYFDCYQAPEAFVPLLASWLDLDWLFTRQPARLDAAAAREISPLGTGRLRDLAAGAARFARLRGTAQGLLDFIETATNIHGLAVDDHVVDDHRKERTFHLRLWAPLEAESWRPTLLRMLQTLKPAYMTAELFTARDLMNTLTQEFDLPEPAVETTLQASGPRPRLINLSVKIINGSSVNPDKYRSVKDRIDVLTPPGEDQDAVPSQEGNLSIWKKSFREWHNL
jgi:hypothetical protein